MTDGRAWPGYQMRFCPVCQVEVGTHREPADDDRGELVVYHGHWDKSDRRCVMDRAAIRAVAFTGTETGMNQRTSAAHNLERPRGTYAADDLLVRLNEQEGTHQ